MMVHTYTLQPMSLQSINFVLCTAFNIDPGQYFKCQSQYSKVNVNSGSHLHPLANIPAKYQFLHLLVSETFPKKDFKGQGHYGKEKITARSYHDTAHLYL